MILHQNPNPCDSVVDQWSKGWRLHVQLYKSYAPFEPAHESMVLFVLRKLNLQTHMRSHPIGLDIWFWSDSRLLPYFKCVNSEGSGETARMRRLAWAFAGRPCDNYSHELAHLSAFSKAAVKRCNGQWLFSGPRYFYVSSVSVPWQKARTSCIDVASCLRIRILCTSHL